MEDLLEAARWMWNNATPKVTLVCVMILAVLQYFQNKKQGATAKTLAEHLDPQNKYPHPACEWGERSYNLLCKELKQQHQENREDHQEIFRLLRDGKKQ